MSPEGNYEGYNILNVKTPDATAPGSDARQKLFAVREKRIKPNRDEKVLTAWNGLMLAAFADAAGVLGNDEYLEVAKNNASFIERELLRDGRLLRTWKDGKAKLNGYIEDYANVADGLIELFQVSGDLKYLTEARRLADLMITSLGEEMEDFLYVKAVKSLSFATRILTRRR